MAEPGLALLAINLPTLRVLVSQWSLGNILKGGGSKIGPPLLGSQRRRSCQETDYGDSAPRIQMLQTRNTPTESRTMRDVEASDDKGQGRMPSSMSIV